MLRALIAAYAGADSRYLNFYGPTGTIETIPYHAILAADREALAALGLAGRIVFVGFSERRQAEQQDEFISVYSERTGLNLSGVEIGATAFANLADMSSVRPLPMWGALVLAAVWGALLAGALSALRSGHAVAAAAVSGTLYLGAALYLFESMYVWVPLVGPLCILLPAVLAATLYFNYRDLGLQRERIQAALGRYVPVRVATRLAQESFDAGASRELVHGTCLVSDAEQFTQLAESMDPESLHTLIQDYFAELTSVVEDYGGFVADISGDSMVAIWAGSRPDAALRRSACDATLSALARIDRFNAARRQQSLPTGIGLDSGELLLGNIGFAQRFQYRAVGDIVNTASRIQGLNRQLGTRALASAAALETLPGFQTRPLGEFLLLGKTNTVLVHELRGANTSDADEGELTERFAAALHLFRQRNWDGARDALERILARYPTDGPARFYLRQCDVCASAMLPEEWSGTIRMNVK
jgi:adenylate cyclase